MKKGIILFFSILTLVFMIGCENKHGLDPKKPITLTMWHNFGGQMKDTMDSMVDEFNATVGAEKGIILSVTSIASSASLHENLIMAANGDPGAPQMPDIATTNPKTAIILKDKNLLAELKSQFKDKELSEYLPSFIEEGMLGGKNLYIFPFAKSTETLFVNKTIFDRFSKETNVSYEDLKTFEGIQNAAQKYYEWTDGKTPEVLNDGKAFYHTDSIFNLTQMGCEQLSQGLIKDQGIDYTTAAFKKLWSYYYDSALKGYFAVYDGYGSDLTKTGEVVCSTGSTAGIAFFDDVVTYPDNTTESLELMVLPYPVWESGEKIAIQRGSGMVVTKSNETKEYAAALFLKWFTKAENNMKFVNNTGYLPVTKTAYENIITGDSKNLAGIKNSYLLDTEVKMYKEYKFFIPPIFEGIDSIQKNYEKKLKQTVKDDRKKLNLRLNNVSKEEAFMEISKGSFENFIK